MTENDEASVREQGSDEQPDVPEPGQSVDVFVDVYECNHCEATVEVADFAHRTHPGYEAATIRCGCKDVPMRRVLDSPVREA